MSQRDKIAYQRGHQLNFQRWVRRGSTSYRWGILLLLSGMAITLVPKASLSPLRAAAVAIIGLGVLGEGLWIFSTWLLDGSPSIVFNDDPDVILRKVRMEPIRRSVRLRRLARLFVPLARIRVP